MGLISTRPIAFTQLSIGGRVWIANKRRDMNNEAEKTHRESITKRNERETMDVYLNLRLNFRHELLICLAVHLQYHFLQQGFSVHIFSLKYSSGINQIGGSNLFMKKNL